MIRINSRKKDGKSLNDIREGLKRIARTIQIKQGTNILTKKMRITKIKIKGESFTWLAG